ncbi:uncharacterized protein LOC111711088 isoform X2 [Eurytemora carolleeae]|nr:uncharacterized protein LOC111711088 isoform X2 [Eurytemora carolleeae]|eukprot:XP_023341110.1 uncharacterized protein LOC111711088 isoform X2 [Eurytemora affinis]
MKSYNQFLYEMLEVPDKLSQLETWHVKQFDESLLPVYGWIQETGRMGWIEETRLHGWEGEEKDQKEWNQDFGGLGWNDELDYLGLHVESEGSELRNQLADWAEKEASKLEQGASETMEASKLEQGASETREVSQLGPEASKTAKIKRRKYTKRSKPNGTKEENQNGQLVELGGEYFSKLESGFQVQGSRFLRHQDFNYGNLIAVPAPIFVMFGFPTGAQYKI